MTDIVERLSVRWEAMGDCAAKKINTILAERKEAAAEITHLRDVMKADAERLHNAILEITRLRAAQQWRPIDLDALKDGRSFVACNARDGVESYEVGRFEPLISYKFVEAGDGLFRKEAYPIYDWTTFNNIHRATHYLVLPSPPTKEGTE